MKHNLTIITLVYPIGQSYCSGYKSCLLGKSEITGSNPTLAFTYQRNKMFLLHSLIKIQYCGEPPCPRISLLSHLPSGLEFRILCVEVSVISFISPSSRTFILAYVCTKVALTPFIHSFIHSFLHLLIRLLLLLTRTNISHVHVWYTPP